MKHASNRNRVRSWCDEEQSVIADTKPEFFSAGKSPYIAVAKFRETM